MSKSTPALLPLSLVADGRQRQADRHQGVITNEIGLDKSRKPKDSFEPGMEFHAPITSSPRARTAP